MIAKALIVLVAFPVFAHLAYTGLSMMLGVILPEVLTFAGTWSAVLGKALVVATLLLAVRVSFGVCRRMWPTPRAAA